MLDSGVGYHSDLPNVITRASANVGIPPVGCYSHATHVAGIVSAARNSVGVIGVAASVPLVSVSVSDTTNSANNCGDGVGETSIGYGLDKIKSLISAHGRVGVVNISMNTNHSSLENFFSSSKSLGQKLADLAAPAAGYPGAFIVQSAGNNWKPACKYAYNASSPSDGIMVVGAVDINGQPVVMLNEMNGFRNQELLGNNSNEPGSNYGSCVDIWAPGNNVYSTWAALNPSVPQSGNQIYSNYGRLSGTSMAAPHVAGVAAWLAETGNLITPVQIEAAIRNYAYYSGSRDKDNIPLLMANAEGARFTAQPTPEFAIHGMVNDNISTTSATPFTLRYDSVGALSCDLTGYLNGRVWYQNLNFSTAFNWGTVQLAPGSYRWVVNCRSAQGTMNSAQATAVVTAPPPAPTANFSFNNQVQANPTLSGASNPWPDPPISIVEIPYFRQPFNFSYNSTNTSTCQLNAYYAVSLWGFWAPWYSVPVMPTYYSWPPVSLERNYYWWKLICTGAGGTVVANFFAHVY